MRPSEDAFTPTVPSEDGRGTVGGNTSEDLAVRMKLVDRPPVAWRHLTAMDGGKTWRPSIRDMLSARSFIDALPDRRLRVCQRSRRNRAGPRAGVAGEVIQGAQVSASTRKVSTPVRSQIK